MCCHRDSKSSKLMMKTNHQTYCVYLLLTPPSKFSWWNPSFQEYLHHRNVQSLRPGSCFCSASWVVNTSLLSPNVPPSLVWPHGGHHCIIYSCVSVCIDYIKIIKFFMCTHVCVHVHTICEGPLTCVAWWRLKVNTMYQSLPYFQNWFSHWTWSSLFWRNQLTTELQRSMHLCPLTLGLRCASPCLVVTRVLKS